jgi:hypothetical protein
MNETIEGKASDQDHAHRGDDTTNKIGNLISRSTKGLRK